MARILLVEDDSWMADCYRLWLSADDHAVSHAADAQAALDHIDDSRPDLIVLDLFLPTANGVQLLQTLQSHSDLADIPIILASSALPEAMPDLSAYGVRAVLDKTTLKPSQLRQAAHEALIHAPVH